jgi:hypothetical protein
MYLGKVSRGIFQETNALDPMAGSILYVLGFFVAIIMWGFGLVWFCLALASIYQSRPFPFNMGWWGFTFPLGVFAASTIQLGIELSSMFFRVLGTVSSNAYRCRYLKSNRVYRSLPPRSSSYGHLSLSERSRAPGPGNYSSLPAWRTLSLRRCPKI